MENTAAMNNNVGVKRPREEEQEQGEQEQNWEAKKLRGDLLLEILDEDDDDDVGSGEDRIPADAVDDLADVMKSFEEEIGVPEEKPQAEEQEHQQRQPELGFLLEASDDELGLPPTATTKEEEEEEEEVVAGVSGGVGGDDGFGQIWGFEDEISSFYDGFGGGGGSAFGDEQDGIVLGSGLFDDDFSLSWPSDFADLIWRPETLPAV